MGTTAHAPEQVRSSLPIMSDIFFFPARFLRMLSAPGLFGESTADTMSAFCARNRPTFPNYQLITPRWTCRQALSREILRRF